MNPVNRKALPDNKMSYIANWYENDCPAQFTIKDNSIHHASATARPLSNSIPIMDVYLLWLITVCTFTFTFSLLLFSKPLSLLHSFSCHFPPAVLNTKYHQSRQWPQLILLGLIPILFFCIIFGVLGRGSRRLIFNIISFEKCYVNLSQGQQCMH